MRTKLVLATVLAVVGGGVLVASVATSRAGHQHHRHGQLAAT